MATSQKFITGPPDYDESKFTWKNYKMEVDMWSELTKLTPEKKGPALWISLTGKAKEVVQDMAKEDIKAADGLTKMMDQLDKIFKIDDNQAAYISYQEFETFRRPSDMSLQDYVVKFESLNSSIKRHDMNLPDGVLAYRFLHSANLQPDKMNLCRATINEFKYEEMKKKVLSLFGDKVHGLQSKIKEEPIFYGGHTNSYRGYRGSYNNRGRGGKGSVVQRGWGNQHTMPQNSNKLNPPGKFGTPSTCAHCGAKYH